MNKLGITQGKAEAVGAFVYVLQHDENRTDFRVNVNRRVSADYEAEEIANANLYVEAHNVANETGLSPLQLKEQRDDLLDALKLVTAQLKSVEPLYGKYKAAIKEGEKAINNCENTLN